MLETRTLDCLGRDLEAPGFQTNTNTLLMGRREESPIELTLSQSVSHYMAYVYDTVDL